MKSTGQAIRKEDPLAVGVWLEKWLSSLEKAFQQVEPGLGNLIASVKSLSGSVWEKVSVCSMVVASLLSSGFQ